MFYFLSYFWLSKRQVSWLRLDDSYQLTGTLQLYICKDILYIYICKDMSFLFLDEWGKIILLASTKSRSARRASHQPAFMNNYLTIRYMCLPSLPSERMLLFWSDLFVVGRLVSWEGWKSTELGSTSNLFTNINAACLLKQCVHKHKQPIYMEALAIYFNLLIIYIFTFTKIISLSIYTVSFSHTESSMQTYEITMS